jgi:aspartyl-tRNA(Asn)/glutamyl-tRNA(Gln) amidotransferase subunit A
MAPPTTAHEIAAAVRAGQCSAEEVCRATLARIADGDGELGAFLEVLTDDALAAARRVDANRAAGEPLGPLAGVPVAIKDNICTLSGHTTCASRILRDFRSPYDATAVARLLAAGAVCVGKTNLDEFAMGSSTENSAIRPTRNPWNRQCVPGGSSGGSTVAVAGRLVPAALGSDTGGSIRQPAALCGVVGLKPTYGRVSRYGLVAYGSSLDQIGPLTTCVTDAALLLSAIGGHDPHDSTSVREPVPDYAAALTDAALDGLRPLRIGVPAEYFGAGLAPEVRAVVEAALELYRGLGATTVPVSLPHMPYAVAVYYVVATAEASSNLARYDGVHYGHRAGAPADLLDLYSASRAEGFGPEVKRRIMLGTFALSTGYYDAYYNKALQVRRLIQQDFATALQQVDVLACPATPTPAFRLGEKLDDPLQMYLADIYTISVNLAGLPALVVPCGFSPAGLPIGLQLIGPLFGETAVLQAGRLYERATDWHTRVPPAGG